MTYADPDFIPVEEQEEEPSYPTAFGITFTPKVSGIVFAVLGLLGAAYLAMNVVQPVFEEYNTLRTQRQEKEGQLQDPQEIQQQIQQKQLELVQANQQNQKVLSLFATENSLDTLLIDINNLVNQRKSEGEDAILISYQPGREITRITDSYLGAAVDGKLKKKSVDVRIEGDFQQIQSILQDIERLQTLVVVKDLRTDISTPQTLYYDKSQGKVVPVVKKDEDFKQAQPTLNTSFTLDVLMPLSEEDKQEAAEAAAEGAQ